MMRSSVPRILLGADHPSIVADVRAALVEAGFHVDWQSLDELASDELLKSSLIVIEESKTPEVGNSCCKGIRNYLGDRFIPILYVIREASPQARQACFDSGADTYLLRPFAPGELLAQVQALLRIKDIHDRLAERTAEIDYANRRLQQAY